MNRTFHTLAAVLLVPLVVSSPGQLALSESQRKDASEAKEYFEHADFAGAERVYERMVAAAPNNLFAVSNLGVVRLRLNKLDSAAEALERAIEIAPEDAFSQRALGIVYYQQKRWEQAAKALTRAAELAPKDASTYRYLSFVYTAQRLHKQAAAALKKSFSLDPDSTYDPDGAGSWHNRF